MLMCAVSTRCEEEVEALYRPIEAAMKESDEPEKLQSRIQMILQNQKRYQDSQKKSIEADRKMVERIRVHSWKK